MPRRGSLEVIASLVGCLVDSSRGRRVMGKVLRALPGCIYRARSTSPARSPRKRCRRRRSCSGSSSSRSIRHRRGCTPSGKGLGPVGRRLGLGVYRDLACDALGLLPGWKPAAPEEGTTDQLQRLPTRHAPASQPLGQLV